MYRTVYAFVLHLTMLSTAQINSVEVQNGYRAVNYVQESCRSIIWLYSCNLRGGISGNTKFLRMSNLTSWQVASCLLANRSTCFSLSILKQTFTLPHRVSSIKIFTLKAKYLLDAAYIFTFQNLWNLLIKCIYGFRIIFKINSRCVHKHNRMIFLMKTEYVYSEVWIE
jgi:hypothetical protein